jgi:hypothetical protein
VGVDADAVAEEEAETGRKKYWRPVKVKADVDANEANPDSRVKVASAAVD